MGSTAKLGAAALLVVTGVAGASAPEAAPAITQPSIAFQSERGCSGLQSGYGGVAPGDIYTVQPDGLGLQHITRDCGSSDPAWSPDGARLAIASTRDGQPAVYVIDADGGNPRRVSRGTAQAAWQPAWSTTGRIAFAVDLPVAERGIWTVNADGTDARHLTAYGEHPSWSADGSLLAFTDTAHRNAASDPAVATMQPDGTSIRPIGFGTSPEFARSGNRIAWVGRTAARGYDITVANADGSNASVPYATSTGIESVTWSPDSGTFAFATTFQSQDIYTVPTSGGAATRLTSYIGADIDPSWRPAVPSSGLVVQRITFPQRACATRRSVATVTVADAQGGALHGATVVLRGGATAARATTNAAGRVTLVTQARAGHRGRLVLTVTVSATGRRSATKRVSLPACR